MGGASALRKRDGGIRVIIADNTAMGAQLLADALRRSRRFGTVVTTNQIADALMVVKNQAPDVALISADFGGDASGGCKLAQELAGLHPRVRLVMLLDVADRAAVVQAFRSGCRGVFCRARSVKELLKCIACVEAGQIWGSSDEFVFVLEALRESQPLRVVNSAGIPLLTNREMSVVRCVADGFTNRETAVQLNLSEHTVKNYMFRIFDKLGVSSRVELILHVANQNQSAGMAPAANRVSSGAAAVAAAGSRVAAGAGSIA